MKLIGVNNAWLSPKGDFVTSHEKFFFEGVAWHEKLALCLLADMWGLDDPMDAFERVHKGRLSALATEDLENMGWVRLHGFGGRTPVWVVLFNQRLTPLQEEVVLDWCLENGVRYEECFAK